ncbi:cell division protein FtsN [Paucimonas lemoignei]|uniref:Cell division protein FtsN n=1 Tax=Paucimonas lemoignei TaxID=29443 RepID=A0A4R3HWB6_PAULE|nr:SPOR domain-containing protein [Paucimonas lemoignei]TCS37442.1 cell division protein FtsN [Paucimonas lemoignei]
MNYRHKQAGGTFLGLILGLIIGLGIAVGVAITINKTPIPFVDRGFKPKDTGEGAQMPDLNKSLYGNREPARQAAKEFQKDPAPAATEPAATGPVVSVPENTAAPVTPVKAASDKAKPADAVAKDGTGKDAAGEEKWMYYLQAGAFREQTDAENAKAKLALLGVESSINERNGDTGTLYRVRVGPFGQVDAMNKVRSKLSDNGVDVAVVRIQK